MSHHPAQHEQWMATLSPGSLRPLLCQAIKATSGWPFLFQLVNYDELTNNDFQSQTWKRLTKALELERERLRELNDGVHYGPVDTAVMRGQIAAINGILALGKLPSAREGARLEEFPAEAYVELQELGIDPMS